MLTEIEKNVNSFDSEVEKVVAETVPEIQRDYGAAVDLSVVHNQYMAHSDNTPIVDFQKTDKGYYVHADGSDVCFMEFGAGVTYQSPYPEKLPDGVVGIGQYGKGNGNKPMWGYYADGVRTREHLMLTRGNPGWHCLINGRENIRRRVREVFKKKFNL